MKRIIVTVERGETTDVPEHLGVKFSDHVLGSIKTLLDFDYPLGSVGVSFALPYAYMCHPSAIFMNSSFSDGNTIGNFLDINGYCIIPSAVSDPVHCTQVYGYITLTCIGQFTLEYEVKPNWPRYRSNLIAGYVLFG